MQPPGVPAAAGLLAMRAGSQLVGAHYSHTVTHSSCNDRQPFYAWRFFSGVPRPPLCLTVALAWAFNLWLSVYTQVCHRAIEQCGAACQCQGPVQAITKGVWYVWNDSPDRRCVVCHSGGAVPLTAALWFGHCPPSRAIGRRGYRAHGAVQRAPALLNPRGWNQTGG